MRSGQRRAGSERPPERPTLISPHPLPPLLYPPHTCLCTYSIMYSVTCRIPVGSKRRADIVLGAVGVDAELRPEVVSRQWAVDDDGVLAV